MLGCTPSYVINGYLRAIPSVALLLEGEGIKIENKGDFDYEKAL